MRAEDDRRNLLTISRVHSASETLYNLSFLENIALVHLLTHTERLVMNRKLI